MKYPAVPAFKSLGDQLSLYSQLKHEYGARNVEPVLSRRKAPCRPQSRD